MSWVVLVASGLFESVWATALDGLSRASGTDRIVLLVRFLIGCAASMGGLAWALRDIPVGTGYAVWTAVGAAATLPWAMVSGVEEVSLVKSLLLAGLVACVVGLKLVSGTGE